MTRGRSRGIATEIAWPDMPTCHDCGAPATQLYDLGPDHGYWMGWREIPVCDACKADRDNYEPPAPTFDEALGRRADEARRIEDARQLKR